MSVDDLAEAVRQQIASEFGDTSDLSEELVNRLCNLYYFGLKAQGLNFGGLTDLQELHPGKSKESLVKIYMAHMGHVTASVSHASELINSMRASHSEDPGVYAYLKQLTIDLFKYCIEGAERIRRGFERKSKSLNEYGSLARRFRVPCRGEPTSRGKRSGFKKCSACAARR